MHERSISRPLHPNDRIPILVLEDGAIVERGRYEELMLRDGPFARLARAGEFVQTELEQSEHAVPRLARAGVH